MKKILSILLCLVMICSTLAMAEESSQEKTPGEILRDLGLIQGVGKGDLNEQGQLTREGMVTMLVRMSTSLDKDFQPPTTPSFKDVPSNHWAYKDIEHAYALGITDGIGDGLFGLGNLVTYQESLAFLLKTLGRTVAWDQVIDYSTNELYMYSTEGAQAQNLLRKHIFDLTIIALNTATEDGTLLVNKTNRFDKNLVYTFRGQASNRYLLKKEAKLQEAASKTESIDDDLMEIDPLEMRDRLSKNLDSFDLNDFKGLSMNGAQKADFQIHRRLQFSEVSNQEFADLLKGTDAFSFVTEYTSPGDNHASKEYTSIPQMVAEDGNLYCYTGGPQGMSIDIYKEPKFYVSGNFFKITYILDGYFDPMDPSQVTSLKGTIVGRLDTDYSVVQVTVYNWNGIRESE